MSNASVEMATVTRSSLSDVRESLLNTWEDLLNDPTRLEVLYFVFDHYSSLFNETINDCVQLMNFGEVCYLLDFDVVRNHLEPGSIDKLDTYAVDSLFYSSKQCYALPAGSFLEFLDWLNTLGLTQNRIADLETSLNREGFIYKLASFLGIHRTDNLTPNEVVEEITDRLNKRAIIVTRLLNILTDPRFLGVVSQYDDDDARKLRRMLPIVPRRRARGYEKRKFDRRKVDQRDAMNLAIAVKSVRNARLAKERDKTAKPMGYILISQTATLLNFPDKIQEYSRHGRTLLGELSDMLHIKASLIHTGFPVMHPRQIITAELLGVFDSPQKTMLRAINFRRQFQTLVDYLLNQLLISESVSPHDIYEKAFGSFVQQEREMISGIFLDLASEMLSPQSPLLEIEEVRAIAESIDYSRAQQKEEHPSEDDEIREKSTRFLELLGQTITALKEVPGFQYRVERLPIVEEEPFQRIRIIQEPSPTGDKPLLFGEKYLRRTREEGWSHYVIRWPVVCSVESFIKAVREIIQPVGNGLVPEETTPTEIPWTHVLETSSYWNEGIVIYTSDQIFGSPLDQLLCKDDGRLLYLRSLRQLLKSQQGMSGFSYESPSEIQQYRINTQQADFILDVVPGEGEKYRFLTLISHHNLALQISLLYKRTEMAFVHPLKLSDAIAEALDDFKDLRQKEAEAS